MTTPITEKLSPLNSKYSMRIRLLVACLLLILAGIAFYNAALIALISAVLNREGSSHGLFVPFISGYFIWIRSEKLKETEIFFSPSGLILVVISIFLILVSHGEYHFMAISFFVLIAGLVWIFLGADFIKKTGFPIFFLITMIPLPTVFYIALANQLRAITYAVSTAIIALLGLTFNKQGYVIHLPNAVLEVAISCSGVRYLISYFVFGLAYAYLTRSSLKNRLLVVLSIFPISIIASICRLTFIYLATYFIGPRMAEHWPHIFISWTVFFVILVLSLYLDQAFLNRREGGKQ